MRRPPSPLTKPKNPSSDSLGSEYDAIARTVRVMPPAGPVKAPRAPSAPLGRVAARVGRAPLRLPGIAELNAGLAPDVRRNFRATLVHWILAGVFVGSVGSYMTVVVRRIGGDELTVALTVAVQFIGGILAIAGPYLFRGIRPERAVAALWTIGRLVLVAALFIDEAGPFLVMLLVWSIIAMMGVPMYVGVTQAAFPRRVRGRLIGAAQAAMAVAVLLVSPLAGGLMDVVGYGPVVAGGAVAGALGGLALFRIRGRPRAPTVRPPPWRMFRQTLANRRFRTYAVSSNVALIGDLLIGPTIAIVLVDTFDASFTLIGVLALIQGITWAAGYLVWGAVSDRRSGPFVVWISTLLKLAIAALFIVAIQVDSLWLLAPAYAVIGLNSAAGDVGWQTSLASLARPEDVDAFATSFWLILGILGIAGPLVGAAVLVAGGPVAAFASALGLAALGSVLMARVAHGFVPADEPPYEAAASVEDSRLAH